MKKKLESELMSIAHRILKLKGREDVLKMHEEARALYEKLSVLKFAHENFEDGIPTIGNNSSFFGMLDTAFNNKISDNIEVEDKIYINLDEAENEEISEPVMNKIKDMVEFMPDEETENVDDFIASVIPKEKYHKNDLEELTSGFKEMPVFEPVSKAQHQNGQEKKSLNDRIKTGGLNIGLNDKIAFINKDIGRLNHAFFSLGNKSKLSGMQKTSLNISLALSILIDMITPLLILGLSFLRNSSNTRKRRSRSRQNVSDSDTTNFSSRN